VRAGWTCHASQTRVRYGLEEIGSGASTEYSNKIHQQQHGRGCGGRGGECMLWCNRTGFHVAAGMASDLGCDVATRFESTEQHFTITASSHKRGRWCLWTRSFRPWASGEMTCENAGQMTRGGPLSERRGEEGEPCGTVSTPAVAMVRSADSHGAIETARPRPKIVWGPRIHGVEVWESQQRRRAKVQGGGVSRSAMTAAGFRVFAAGGPQAWRTRLLHGPITLQQRAVPVSHWPSAPRRTGAR
jgi:hypothetical protein